MIIKDSRADTGGWAGDKSKTRLVESWAGAEQEEKIDQVCSLA